MTVNKKILITVVLCASFAALVLVGFAHRLTKPRILTDHELRQYGAMMLSTPRKFSDFEFSDHRGNRFTQQNLLGKWTLIFFGFSHCPDICPTTLAELNKVIAPLKDKEKENIQVVMLSVDPERDTVEKLGQYMPYFNEDFIGLTGDPFQLLSVATQLGVVYTRVPLADGDYTVDHSGNIVIINPRGHYHGFFRPPFEEGSLRVSLRSLMHSFD
ncbi:MAG: SCO family protein [Porticoccaceae bacterium]|nr:SCO family protein [Porticoccaceae bacterium]